MQVLLHERRLLCAPKGDVFLFRHIQGPGVSKGFFSSRNNPNQSTKEMDLAALALTERVCSVGGGVRDTVDTLGAAGHVLGGLLALGLDTILDIVVDDRLAGRV